MIEVVKNAPLADHTYFGVGGPADELVTIGDLAALPEIWAETIALRLPRLVLGSGSNLVCSDAGFRGRVFKIVAEKTDWRDEIVTVDAGKNLQQLILDAASRGWSDLANLAGIPGTVGGAVRGNAGAFGSETRDRIVSVEFCDENGTVRRLPARTCAFGYRDSIFKKNPDWCVLRATFQLHDHIDRTTALQQAQTLIETRWKKYPPGRCGGSFFKNPTTVPADCQPFAGWLLEQSGAKSDRIGGAEISSQHANFLMNADDATQADVLALAKKWHHIVREKFGVDLDPEVVLIDDHGRRILIAG